MTNFAKKNFFINRFFVNDNISALNNIIESQQYNNFIDTLQYLTNNNDKNIINVFTQLLFKRRLNVEITNSMITQHQSKLQKFNTMYLLQYKQYIADFKNKLNSGYIFANKLHIFYQQNKNILNDERIKTAVQLYESYQQTQDVKHQYRLLQAVQWLIYGKQITKEFMSYQKYLSLILDCLNNTKIDSVEKFKCKLCLGLFHDNVEIVFDFNNDFTVNTLTDDDLLDLFQRISECIFELSIINTQQSICFVRNIHTNQIFRFNSSEKQEAPKVLNSLQQYLSFNIKQKNVKDNIIEFLEKFVKESESGGIFDIIFIGTYCKVIENIRVRHLHYTKSISFDENNLKLQYPEDINSLALQNISISNLYECVNIVNISTKNTSYQEKDIKQLKNLIRIKSNMDRFTNEEQSVLHHLLVNNKLQYINIEQGFNVTHKLVLQQNIEYLRYFFISQHNTMLDIVFNPDPSKRYKLQVFQASYTNNRDKIIIYYVPNEQVINNKIVKHLIHNLELDS